MGRAGAFSGSEGGEHRGEHRPQSRAHPLVPAPVRKRRHRRGGGVHPQRVRGLRRRRLPHAARQPRAGGPGRSRAGRSGRSPSPRSPSRRCPRCRSSPASPCCIGLLHALRLALGLLRRPIFNVGFALRAEAARRARCGRSVATPPTPPPSRGAPMTRVRGRRRHRRRSGRPRRRPGSRPDRARGGGPRGRAAGGDAHQLAQLGGDPRRHLLPEGLAQGPVLRRGRRALYAYCAERGIPHARPGKLIVAPPRRESPRSASSRPQRRPTASPTSSCSRKRRSMTSSPTSRCVRAASLALHRPDRQPRAHGLAQARRGGRRRAGGAGHAGALRARRRGRHRAFRWRRRGGGALPAGGELRGSLGATGRPAHRGRAGLGHSAAAFRQGALLRHARQAPLPSPDLSGAGPRRAGHAPHPRSRRPGAVRSGRAVVRRSRLQLRRGAGQPASMRPSGATTRGFPTALSCPGSPACGPRPLRRGARRRTSQSRGRCSTACRAW